MKSSPSASFIIVNYNGEKYLQRLLTSLLDQSNQSFEIIIIDNASTDNSLLKIKEFINSLKTCPSGRRVKNFKLKINLSNLGYGLGCNLGAKKAVGQFLIFLNPDTFVPPDFLLNYLKFYRQKLTIYPKNIGCINCRIVEYNSPSTEPKDWGGGVIDIFGTPRESTNLQNVDDSFFVFGTALFIDRLLFLKTKGFHPNIFLYGEEIDLCWRLKTQGYRHLIDNRNFFYHLGGGSFGNNRPRQVALMTYGCFIGTVTNFQTISLIFILPLYFIYLISILIFLPTLKGFNFKYNQELFLIFKKLLTDYKSILQFRRFVQNNRLVSDFKLLKYVSIVPSIITRLNLSN